MAVGLVIFKTKIPVIFFLFLLLLAAVKAKTSPNIIIPLKILPTIDFSLFNNSFPPEFGVSPDPDLINTPIMVHPEDIEKVPAPGKPLESEDFKRFVRRVSEEIAKSLDLKKI